jgi:hypothetical protein
MDDPVQAFVLRTVSVPLTMPAQSVLVLSSKAPIPYMSATSKVPAEARALEPKQLVSLRHADGVGAAARVSSVAPGSSWEAAGTPDSIVSSSLFLASPSASRMPTRDGVGRSVALPKSHPQWPLFTGSPMNIQFGPVSWMCLITDVVSLFSDEPVSDVDLPL